MFGWLRGLQHLPLDFWLYHRAAVLVVEDLLTNRPAAFTRNCWLIDRAAASTGRWLYEMAAASTGRLLAVDKTAASIVRRLTY